MLGEISRSAKGGYCVRAVQPIKTEREGRLPGGGNGGSVFNGDRASVREDEAALQVDGGDGRTT